MRRVAREPMIIGCAPSLRRLAPRRRCGKTEMEAWSMQEPDTDVLGCEWDGSNGVGLEVMERDSGLGRDQIADEEGSGLCKQNTTAVMFVFAHVNAEWW